MLADTPTVSQISHMISQATAPAFLLGALAAFVSVLMARLTRVIDRSQALNAIDVDDAKRAHLREDLPRLKRRSQLLNNSILFASISAIVITVLVVVAFASAFLAIEHERGAAALFTVSMGYFATSLVNLRERPGSRCTSSTISSAAGATELLPMPTALRSPGTS